MWFGNGWRRLNDIIGQKLDSLTGLNFFLGPATVTYSSISFNGMKWNQIRWLKNLERCFLFLCRWWNLKKLVIGWTKNPMNYQTHFLLHRWVIRYAYLGLALFLREIFHKYKSAMCVYLLLCLALPAGTYQCWAGLPPGALCWVSTDVCLWKLRASEWLFDLLDRPLWWKGKLWLFNLLVRINLAVSVLDSKASQSSDKSCCK